MKVSVIIPIFNTGEYLRPCIESICNQTHHDLQIIMIDDGSDAHTAGICDSIASSDNRIILHHKKNEGVSVARNTGLSIADGDVVCFVDSDDTIEPDMIESLVTALERDNSQIAMCDAVTLTPGKPDQQDTIPDFKESCVLSTQNIEAGTLSRLAGSVCRCAYRRTATLSMSGASFPVGIKFSEDRIFNLMAMSAAHKISYIKLPLYNRLIRAGSACFRYYPDMTEQIEKMREILIPTVRRYWSDKYIPVYESQIAGQIKRAISNYTAPANKLSTSESIIKIKELCSNKSIKACLNTTPVKDRRISLILNESYLQLYILGKLLNYYHKLCRKGQYQA